jgi:hypothetical protein
MNPDDSTDSVVAGVIGAVVVGIIAAVVAVGAWVALDGRINGSAASGTVQAQPSGEQLTAELTQSLATVQAALDRFDREPVNHAALAAALDRQVFGYPAGSTDVPPSNLPLLDRAAHLMVGLGDAHRLSIRAGADAGLAPAEAKAQGQARADAIRDVFLSRGVPESSIVASSGAASYRHVEFTVTD